MSTGSVCRMVRITCHVGWVYSREADNSYNADKANTVMRVSGRCSRYCQVDPLTTQPLERNQSIHISVVLKYAAATKEVRA